MELSSLPVDLFLSLQFSDLFKLEDHSLNNRLGTVHLVVLAGLAQGSLDDVTWEII